MGKDMSYGSNGSVIGPDNVPTTSAASGVWSLGEIAESVRDGIWPAPVEAYELLSTTTVSSASSTITLSAIPQDYRDLKIVARSASLNVYGDLTWVQLNGDSTAGNYRLYQYGATASGASTGTYEAVHYGTSASRMPYGDWPQGSSGRGSLNERQAAEFHIPNYTAVGATSGTGIYCYTSGINDMATPNYNTFFQWSGMTWTGTAAVTSIVLYNAGSGTNYEFQPNTQVSLYGIGTAP
jgi:hypothetical protein